MGASSTRGFRVVISQRVSNELPAMLSMVPAGSHAISTVQWLPRASIVPAPCNFLDAC